MARVSSDGTEATGPGPITEEQVAATDPATVEDTPYISDTIFPPETEANVEFHAGRPALKELSKVEYIGPSDVRVLTVEDLQRVGIDSPKGDLTFDAGNGHSVDIKDINAATADWFAAQPDEFRLV